ncbi:MAG: hypothetical protein WD136_02185 [Cyanobium sp.]
MVVTQAALDALDALIWLNSGYVAAEFCGCHQSSISRRAQEAAAVFGVALVREKNYWCLSGSTVLLELEREVHQLHRLLRGKHLRLDVAPELIALLPALVASPWIAVCAESTIQGRTQLLLQDRVIDGWLTVMPVALSDGQGAVIAPELSVHGLGGEFPDGAALMVRHELAGHPVCEQLLGLIGALNDGAASGARVEKMAVG